MKKTIIRLIILVLFVFITISTLGCGDEKEVINDGSTDGITKVCLIINGNLGDKSFFDSANEGIKMINNSHPEIVTTVKEIGQNTSNWESSLREVCESGEKYDLIIVGTDQMREKLQRIAPLYPGKKFIIFDADINKEAKGKTFNNVYSIK